MNAFPHLYLICLTLLCVSLARGATTTVPEERDGQVLQSLLLHLLTDKKLDLTRVSTNAATIILHARTPEGTGFLMSHQMRSDIGSRTLPRGAEGDSRRRNTRADAKPDSYDSVAASYTNLTFASGIVVVDLTELWKQKQSFRSFEDAHPKARAYLPGYSKDGTRAVVRAGVGPSAHGAMLTAVLEKVADKWIVKWYDIALYV